MAITDTILSLFSINGLHLLIKIVCVITELMYVFYTFLVTRQIKNMNESLFTPIAPVLSLVAYMQMATAIVIVLITLLFA
jgi:hypothetical protein